MSKKQFNSLPNFSSSHINVDRENDVLKNVSIANFGKNKNDSYFDEKFIISLVEKGNAQTQGVKSRFGHPSMCATSLGTYIGRYKNFNIQNGNCFADLHLDPITKKTQVEGKGIMMYDYIMDMSESNPDMFGNSIHITHIRNEKPTLVEGFEVLELNDITSSDLVDDPAATNALFSSNPNDLGIVVTQFLDENPALFESVNKNPEIIQDFFERYFNYHNRKSLINFNMSFLDKLKKKFSTKEDTFDLDITLADGSIVTVVTDAEMPQVGDNVVDDAGGPVPNEEGKDNATHLLPDGGSIVTVDGTITEINDTPEAANETEPTLQEVMNSVNAIGKSFSAFKSKFESAQKDNEEAFELLGEQFGKVDKRVTEMGKTVKSKYDVPPVETPEKKKPVVAGYDADKVAEARKKLNEKKK
jgi:hypothetical protein